MNITIFILFLITSIILVYKEKKYILLVINLYKNSTNLIFLYLIIFSIPFITFYNYSTIFYFLLTIWSIFLAIVFLKSYNLEYLYIAIKYLIYLYITFILIYLYYTFGEYPLGYKLEYMINDKVSANGVTSFLDILLAIYTALKIKLKNKSTILISLISLYISIQGYGRGSIIFVSIIILINLIFIFFTFNKKMKFIFLGIFILISSVSITYTVDIYQNTKLASGFESPRSIIFYEYLNKIDSFSLFFGASYENTIISDEYNNNPHITYIRSHHIFGLFYLLGIFYIIFKKMFNIITSKNLTNWMILLIIINILTRTITEPLLFPSIFDSLFIVILFLTNKKTNKENT